MLECITSAAVGMGSYVVSVRCWGEPYSSSGPDVVFGEAAVPPGFNGLGKLMISCRSVGSDLLEWGCTVTVDCIAHLLVDGADSLFD